MENLNSQETRDGTAEQREDAEHISSRLAAIRSRIAAACRQAGRGEDEVELLLATKTVPAARIRRAIDAGARLIGENRVQELATKESDLRDLPCKRHFIGHLQSNKIKDVLRYVSCIQSIDSLGLAEKLDRELQKTGRALDVLIQVNTSGEASKFGVPIEEAASLVRSVARLDTLRIKGLMTIGLLFSHGEAARRCFVELRELRERIAGLDLASVEMRHLSMGMSPDFEEAIREGATIVRVGLAVFGPRPTKPGIFWDEADRLERQSG